MKFFIFTAICLCTVTYGSSREIDVTQTLRIHQLMPQKDLLISLGVEPALPPDFIALSKKGEIDYSDCVYWGPENVLKAYFKDPNSLSTPILKVRIADFITQSQLKDFHRNFLKEASKGELKFIHSGNWGSYPYYCLEYDTPEAEKTHLGLIGLNEDSDSVLAFILVSPKKEIDQGQGLKLWENFFKQTKELPFPLFIKALGQEMHKGYTIVNVIGRKIKVFAEQRRSDKKLQFIVMPEDKNVKFAFRKSDLALMGADWHKNEPILKIHGSYIIDDGWMNYSHTTSVLIKEVDEFADTSNLKSNAFVK